jgi:putative flippase GtrA
LRPLDELGALARFSISGLVSFATNFLVYAVCLTRLEAPPPLAAVCSFTAAVGVGYVLNRIWTFRSRQRAVAGQVARYVAISLASLGVGVAALTLLISLGVGPLEAQAIAIVVLMPPRFLLNRSWAFR